MRRDLLYLHDAIVHTERALAYLSDFEASTLPKDQMRFDAILRNLQVIGEAVKQIPDEMRLIRPDIPWAKIAGLRNRLVHHYFGIDPEIVIDICEHHLAPLRDALKQIELAYSDLN